jgi:capsular exopolysaccharide synthesis family protein
LFEVLWRQRWIVLGSLLFCFAIGVWLASKPRNYTADGMLRVQLGTESQYRASPGTPASDASADEFAPFVDILESRTLFLRVAKDLDLANNPQFMGGKIAGHKSMDDAGVRNGVLRAMRGRITVNHKPKDEIIRLSCATLSPTLSARVVNTMINDFVDELMQTRYGASQRASGWLAGQLSDLKQQVEKDQADLTALQAKLGIVGPDAKDSDYLLEQSLDSLAKASSDATVNRIVAEAKYRFLKGADPALIEGEVNLLGGQGGNGPQASSLLQNLRNAQAVQSSDYAKLLSQFGPNYPEVVQKKSQLDETARQVKAEENRILNQAKLSYSAASANEEMTQKALQTTQGNASGMQSDMVKYVILQHDYESHRTLYESLISRLQEAGITAGLGGGEVDIVDLADVPTLPTPPGRLTYLGGSIVAGLLLGFVLAFMLEAISTRIMTVDQALRSSSLPMLGALPEFSWNTMNLGSQQDSPYLEAVESLRGTLLSSTAPPHVVLVTSPSAGEGKSTTSAYLASTLAQHSESVLLIDCDLRNQSLAASLGLLQTVGLSSILQGKATLDSAMQQVPSVPNLRVIVSGPPVERRPSVLLSSADFANLLSAAQKRFRFVVLNCPPVLGLPDVLNIGKFADTILLVVRSNVTRRKSLQLAEQTLQAAHLPIAGYVLNSVPPGLDPYYGYHPRKLALKSGTERGVA